MKECNELILYNNLTSHMHLIDYFDSFGDYNISGKSGDGIYYLKEKSEDSSAIFDNVVYLSWFELIDNKQKTLERLEFCGLLDIEYNKIILEKARRELL